MPSQRIDTNRLWHDIVQLTGRAKDENVRSLRVPLLSTLWTPTDRPQWKQIGRMMLNSRSLLPRTKSPLPAAPQGKITFFFVDNAPLVMQHLLPVVLEADRRGLLGGIVVLYDFPDIKEFADRIPMVTTGMLESQSGLQERVSIAKEAISIYHELFELLSGYDPNYRRVCAKNAGSLLDYIVTSLRMARAFQTLYEAWKPSCVVTPSDFWPQHYQFSHQATRAHIPSFTIQHGISNFFAWPFVSDVCCVWGEAFAEELQRWGAPLDRLAVTGLPSTDRMFRQAKPAAYWTDRDRSKPVCLFLSQTHGEQSEPVVFAQYKELVMELVKQIPSVAWKVKLHPTESDAFYRAMGQEICDRLIFHPKNVSLEEAVHDADVVTTTYSTSGLEAMIMNRPLIVAPALPRVQELAWWPAAGGGAYAYSAQDFCDQLSQLVSEREHWAQQLERQSGFLSKSFSNQGRAAESIVDLLERCCRQHQASQTQPYETAETPVWSGSDVRRYH